MNGLSFIKQKQSSWAQRQGFELVSGTIGTDGEKTYLQNVADNLFEPLTQDSADSYNAGDGGETKDTGSRLAKMKECRRRRRNQRHRQPFGENESRTLIFGNRGQSLPVLEREGHIPAYVCLESAEEAISGHHNRKCRHRRS